MDSTDVTKCLKDAHQFFLSHLKLDYLNDELNDTNDGLDSLGDNNNPSKLTNQTKIKFSQPKYSNSSKLMDLEQCNFTVVKLAELYNELVNFVKCSIRKKMEFKKCMTEIDDVMKQNLNSISSQLNVLEEQLNTVKKEKFQCMVHNIELNKKNQDLSIELEKCKKKIADLEQKEKENIQTFKIPNKDLLNSRNNQNQEFKNTINIKNDKKILSSTPKLQFNNMQQLNKVINKKFVTNLWKKRPALQKINPTSNTLAMDPKLRHFVKVNKLNWQKNIKKKFKTTDISSINLKIRKLAEQGKWIRLKEV